MTCVEKTNGLCLRKNKQFKHLGNDDLQKPDNVRKKWEVSCHMQ